MQLVEKNYQLDKSFKKKIKKKNQINNNLQSYIIKKDCFYKKNQTNTS